MKQAFFVKLNQDKWAGYEQQLDQGSTSADDLAKMYVHLTEDLAFAKAKYPRTSLTAYLNKLSLKVHNLIYRNKPENKGRLTRFWKFEVPYEMAMAGKPMLYAFLIMTVGVVVGIISTANDETFARLILGDAYVDMTLENIKKGDPMGVYGSMDQWSMFFMITSNNIRVSFLAFVFGFLTSAGTGMILFRNGIMLGVFNYFFVQQGLFDETMLSVWVHGTIEISAIVIAGGAGIKMGNGLLFPGSYPRAYAFKKAAKSGLKIVMGLVPFFILAGFIESFLTRYTQWPLAAKLAIILGSFALIVYYFILLPIKTYRNVTTKN
ncbi:MAG: stage II sporulation protein M [Ekhidna sp.]|uniref:stage II sporulation protein M n=1 Tax=Ekhidna sp. TaxID=2608089 RepID=UPI0032EE6AB9